MPILPNETITRPRTLKSTQGLWQPTRVAGATPEKSKEHPNLRILPFPKKWQDGDWILRYAGGRLGRLGGSRLGLGSSNRIPVPPSISLSLSLSPSLPLSAPDPSERKGVKAVVQAKIPQSDTNEVGEYEVTATSELHAEAERTKKQKREEKAASSGHFLH